MSQPSSQKQFLQLLKTNDKEEINQFVLNKQIFEIAELIEGQIKSRKVLEEIKQNKNMTDNLMYLISSILLKHEHEKEKKKQDVEQKIKSSFYDNVISFLKNFNETSYGAFV